MRLKYKHCIYCGKIKPLAQFAMKRAKPQGRCKSCHSQYQREYYLHNRDKYKTLQELNRKNSAKAEVRARSRAKMYGLTVDEYQDLKTSNDGMCHLCNRRPGESIDHDHETGKVRGHLCNNCNTGLGKLGDTIESLQEALNYLRKTT